MKIFIGCDHAGIEVRDQIVEFLHREMKSTAREVVDLGTHETAGSHYPDYALKVCRQVVENNDHRGILICGSGIGMSMMANRFQGIRAALCHSEKEAVLSREHNAANVLCLGARLVEIATLCKIVRIWCLTEGPKEERHLLRLKMMDQWGSRLIS